jgi:hypothetical protein
MSKLKKGLLGTSLAAGIVAAAGYGTFALWSSDPVEVGGSVDNLVVKLSSDVKEINYEVDVGGEKAFLAPGRTAIGDWVTLTNDSSEGTNFNFSYHLQLLQDNEPPQSEKISLNQYHSAALFVNDNAFAAKELDFAKGLSEFLSDPDNFVTDPENMVIDFGGARVGVAINHNPKTTEWLISNFQVGEIDGILFPDSAFFPDSTFFPDGYFNEAYGQFFPDDYFNEERDRPVLFPDTIFDLAEGQNIHFLFGTHLKEDTGNEYQGLTLDTEFKFASKQKSADPVSVPK